MQLADAVVGYVRREVAQRRVLLREHVKTGRLEGHVERGHDVPVAAQVVAEMELPVKVPDGRVVLGQRLQHHLVVRAPVLDQQDLAEPTLADDLHDVERLDQIDLGDTRPGTTVKTASKTVGNRVGVVSSATRGHAYIIAQTQ